LGKAGARWWILSSRGEFIIVTKSGEERRMDITTTTIDFNKRPAVIG